MQFNVYPEPVQAQEFKPANSIRTSLPGHVIKVLKMLEKAGMFQLTDTLEMETGYSLGVSIVHAYVYFEVRLHGVEDPGQVSVTGEYLTVTDLRYTYLKLEINMADRDDELEVAVEEFLELLRKVYGGLPVIIS